MKPCYESVFKIFCDSIEYNPLAPWQSNHTLSSGTVFCVEHDSVKYLISCDHVFGANSMIIIKTPWGDIVANIAQYDAISDICLLTIDKKSKIYKQMKPLKLGVVSTGDIVYSQGFPLKYRGLSVTRGIVSRLTKMEYGSGFKGLVFQTDAPISAGSSGGPLFNMSSEVVGITFSADTSGNSVFFSIPFFIIHHFLSFVAKDAHITYNVLPNDWQTMTPEMVKLYGEGSVFLIEEQKVFSKIEGIEIDKNHQISYEEFLKYLGFSIKTDEKISFHYIIQFIQSDHVLLDDKKYKLTALSREKRDNYEFIQYGGYVFIPVNDYTRQAIFEAYGYRPENGLFISDIFETPTNKNYVKFRGSTVKSINGEPATIETFHKSITKKINILTLHYEPRCIYIDDKDARIDTKVISEFVK